MLKALSMLSIILVLGAISLVCTVGEHAAQVANKTTLS